MLVAAQAAVCASQAGLEHAAVRGSRERAREAAQRRGSRRAGSQRAAHAPFVMSSAQNVFQLCQCIGGYGASALAGFMGGAEAAAATATAAANIVVAIMNRNVITLYRNVITLYLLLYYY